ncbi:hypothetical protein MK280_13980 [Myxococcota bacterium]|nr:hypothetical protein [Myxococcota bacterium]
MTTAMAHEIQLGINSELGFQTNALKTPINPKADGIFVLMPIVTLSQPQEALSYNIEYRPRFTAYMTTEGIDGVDHLLRGRGSYQIDSRDSLFFRTDFLRTRQIRNESAIDASGQPITVSSANGISQQFFLELVWERSFSARSFGTASLGYDRWDYTTENNIDNQGFRGELAVNRVLKETFIVGMNAGARYRAFAASRFSPPSYTTTVNMNLSFDYRISEKWRLRGAGGPAGVFVEEQTPGAATVSRFAPTLAGCDDGVPCGRLWSPPPAAPDVAECVVSFGVPVLLGCPTSSQVGPSVPGFLSDTSTISLDPAQADLFGERTRSLTYFLNFSLVRRFEKGLATAAFIRNEDAGNGFGTSTILNSVSAQFRYPLSEFWDLSFSALYTFRESVANLQGSAISARAAVNAGGQPLTDVDGRQLAEASAIVATSRISNFEQQVGLAELRLVRKLGPNTRFQLFFVYYNQRDRNGGSPWRSFDNVTGVASFVYTFDPYQL